MRLSIFAAATAAALLLGSTTTATADVQRGGCGQLKARSDRACLAAKDSRGPWVALHVERRRGHDWAWASGMISDRGRLWLEVSHDGHTKTVGMRRAPADGSTGQSLLSTRSVYDGPGYRVRACGNEANGAHRACTRWH
ncbi:hypothetical protein [Streptomyces sp. NPDC002952]|uniref:hypothetical protein n=1 Tax=Streptomyces sp. NPDC002952 TaxID=3364673 RepID=UPI0036A2E1A5